MSRVIRDATPEDAAACAAIYAPYVIDTSVSFETEAPTDEQMAERIVKAQKSHAWLVLEDEGQVVGYAYGGMFRERLAYRFTCEVSVYLDRTRRRTGGGRLLYEALLPRLTDRGFRTAVAGMTLPNDASVALHEAMGFTSVGTFAAAGWKFDQWHDVGWVQRSLVSDTGPPAELR